MRIIDFHVHLSDPAWQERDPVVSATNRGYGLVRDRLPAGARAALELGAGLAAPTYRRFRDGALALIDRALATSRNRSMYLGEPGVRVASALEPLFVASVLRGTPARLLGDMDAAGISSACVLPVAPHTTTELALRLCGSPRLIPFCSLAPGTRDVHAALAAYRARGCRGVKIHPTLQDTPPDSPFYREVARAAGELDLVLVTHTGTNCYQGFPHGHYCAPAALEPLVRENPRTRFVLAHMNLFRPDEAIELAQRAENVWLDTSWQPAGVIRRAARALGDRRLVFGSDWPFPGTELGTALAIIRDALSDRTDALENVLGRNAEELLGIRAPEASRP